ncbi:MAG: hypothetical protein UT34_C0001G0063 [candidate division WS6 bacterium GW2011_GWF2_39_15]|uniref:LTD domain-containing protein n=1 Tax=candidate division WS6 bacterium GW2011_GWF2_39_15 TaxID=1619100 RepID=A0A0G0MS73_9BACT|nr:MAG: hypothetical protein UT34_C0001G0063 [candidate division WS6 bacterium GW2011_GWF2_39_15]
MVQNTILKNIYGLLFLLSVFLLLIVAENIVERAYASASIVINEVMYDPQGTDTGYEWIELYNPLSIAISLNNWKIQTAGVTFSDTAILGNIEIPAHTYITICESKVPNCTSYVAKLSIQNGGSESDGLQILDSKGNVVDTVIYDSPNTNNLTKENGLIIDSAESATPSESGKSIGRKNHIDTDNSYNDFYIFEIPTFGIENTASEELAPTGQPPLQLLSLILLFILLVYSDRLIQKIIILIKKINATYKIKSYHK